MSDEEKTKLNIYVCEYRGDVQTLLFVALYQYAFRKDVSGHARALEPGLTLSWLRSYYDQDADLDLLKGKTIVFLG